uniref:NADH-ubiquinone oxidoreductase chain 6 n=1 Tax=Nemopilema nomurai TaxID=321803 RepID=A0A343FMY8_9CNID|nr:NADH dehydrogenase subunit 6 [Nemopilema nomurai]ASR75160.1 NADH dehydrogenase subunit 6 [Nemopilema nomurai]
MALTIISGMMVITAIHPVHSIIWLVLAFVNSALFFIQLGADFIALTSLIIYVGAIAILFIFVLMMLNLSSYDLENEVSSILPLSIVSGLGIITIITSIHFTNTDLGNQEILLLKEFSTIQSIGSQLYLHFGDYLIIASIILLVGMIGSIVLTLSTSHHTKKQNNFTQIIRDTYNF